MEQPAPKTDPVAAAVVVVVLSFAMMLATLYALTPPTVAAFETLQAVSQK